MSMSAYLTGAWLTACIMAVGDGTSRPGSPILRLIAAMLLTLAWPVVWVIFVGEKIRYAVLYR